MAGGRSSVRVTPGRRLASALLGMLTAVLVVVGALPAAAAGPATGSLAGVVLGPSGAPHGQGRVTAFALDQEGVVTGLSRTVDIDENGRFAFPVLEAGMYKVFVSAEARRVLDEYWRDAVSAEQAATVTVLPGESVELPAVDLDTAGVVSGTITTYEGAAYPGARAFLRRVSPGWPGFSQQATADGQGRFAFDDVLEGSYRLSFAPPLDSSRRAHPSDSDREITVGRSEALSGLEGRAWYVTDLRGTVRDPRGEPAAGAEVVLRYRDGESIVTTSDAEGDYSFSQSRPGEATLSFREFGMSATTWLGGGDSFASAQWFTLDTDAREIDQQIRLRTFSGLHAVVNGISRVGQTLVGGGNGGNLETVRRIEWLADGKPIAGATRDEFRLTAAQRGARISVRVTWSEPGYVTVVRVSTSTAPVVAGTLIAPRPAVSGSPGAGLTLRAATGRWTAGAMLSYQWYASGRAIAGANRSSFTLPKTMVGKPISVTVTGRKAGYATATRTSTATAKVAQTATPSITGSAHVGRRLSARPGNWTSGTRFAYQWYANGKPIAKATASSLIVPSHARGMKITVNVAGRKAGYATVVRTSRATAAVTSTR